MKCGGAIFKHFSTTIIVIVQISCGIFVCVSTVLTVIITRILMKEKRILKITAIVHSFYRWKRGCLKLTITGNVHNVWIWTNELCKYKLFEAFHNSQKIKSYSAGRFPDFIDLNNLKENRSCVMNWSEQLPRTLVTAFSRTSLFFERLWCKFWISFKFHKPYTKTYRPKSDIFLPFNKV